MFTRQATGGGGTKKIQKVANGHLLNLSPSKLHNLVKYELFLKVYCLHKNE